MAAQDPVVEQINVLIGVYWTGMAQHHTHAALVEAWGLQGLAAQMRAHIADEPGTIAQLTNRLLDLGGVPAFELSRPDIGATVAEVLDKDLSVQRLARPALNAAAEVAAAAHDATTRNLFEQILADEELHLAWLETERDLLERLGEPLYTAQRLEGASTSSVPPAPEMA